MNRFRRGIITAHRLKLQFPRKFKRLRLIVKKSVHTPLTEEALWPEECLFRLLCPPATQEGIWHLFKSHRYILPSECLFHQRYMRVVERLFSPIPETATALMEATEEREAIRAEQVQEAADRGEPPTAQITWLAGFSALPSRRPQARVAAVFSTTVVRRSIHSLPAWRLAAFLRPTTPCSSLVMAEWTLRVCGTSWITPASTIVTSAENKKTRL